MTNLSKICYQIHHIDNDDVLRNNLVKYSHDVLSSDIDFLYSDTISIYNEEDLKAFALKYPKFKLNGYTHNFRYPEIGLWGSTYVALKDFIDSKYDYILLLEDDVTPENNFINLFNKYFSQLPEDWECFVVYNAGGEDEAQYDIGLEDICKAYQVWSTGSIMFNKKSANLIIDYIENFGISLPLDIFLYYKTIKEVGGDILNEYHLEKPHIINYTVKLNRPPLVRLIELETQIQNSDRINRLHI